MDSQTAFDNILPKMHRITQEFCILALSLHNLFGRVSAGSSVVLL